MKRQFKSGKQDVYPEWHQKPFRLSLAEIGHPQRIVDDFFKQYDLDIFHSCIDQCSCTLPVPPQNPGAVCPSFFRDLEKMLEAVYVISQYDYHNWANDNDLKTLPTAEQAKADASFWRTYGIEKPILSKERFYLDPLPVNPMQVLSRIFQSSSDDSLKSTIKRWQMIAISEEYFEYQDGQSVVNLFIVCEALQKLIEALYIICAAWCRYTQNDEPLFLNRECTFLKKEERDNPYLVIIDFKQRFPYRHVRAEIWDLMHALTHYQIEKSGKTHSLMEHFELLLCMIKAPYLLKEDATLLSLIPGIPVKNDNNH